MPTRLIMVCTRPAPVRSAPPFLTRSGFKDNKRLYYALSTRAPQSLISPSTDTELHHLHNDEAGWRDKGGDHILQLQVTTHTALTLLTEILMALLTHGLTESVVLIFGHRIDATGSIFHSQAIVLILFNLIKLAVQTRYNQDASTFLPTSLKQKLHPRLSR